MNKIKIDNYYKPESKTLRLDEADLNQTDINAMQVLLRENQELKEKLDKYENPEDMTLFTMWCTEKVKDENKELKKQLENCYCNRTDCSSRIKDSKKYDSLVQKVETQQKEFIKYLEDEIKKEKEDLEHLCDLYKIPQKNNSTYKFVYSYINKIEKILQKYKSVIGISDENNIK